MAAAPARTDRVNPNGGRCNLVSRSAWDTALSKRFHVQLLRLRRLQSEREEEFKGVEVQSW
jgi:hypothetical protein